MVPYVTCCIAKLAKLIRGLAKKPKSPTDDKMTKKALLVRKVPSAMRPESRRATPHHDRIYIPGCTADALRGGKTKQSGH